MSVKENKTWSNPKISLHIDYLEAQFNQLELLRQRFVNEKRYDESYAATEEMLLLGKIIGLKKEKDKTNKGTGIIQQIEEANKNSFIESFTNMANLVDQLTEEIRRCKKSPYYYMTKYCIINGKKFTTTLTEEEFNERFNHFINLTKNGKIFKTRR